MPPPLLLLLIIGAIWAYVASQRKSLTPQERAARKQQIDQQLREINYYDDTINDDDPELDHFYLP